MVRPPDPFWDFVVEMDDGSKKCMFCDHLYTRATSVSRVKRHLSGVPRYGVKICEKVPEDVQEAARVAIDSPPEKKLRTAASSSNNEAGGNRISTNLRQQQNNEAENVVADCSPGSALEWMQRHIGEVELDDEGISSGDPLENTTMGLIHQGDTTELEGMQMHSQLLTRLQPTDPADNVVRNNMENTMSMRLMQHIEGGGFPGRFTVDEDGQPTDLQCQINERHCNQICFPSVTDNVLRNDEGNMTRGLEQIVVGDSSHEGIRHITADEARGDTFPAPKLVGGEFEKYKNAIWSWLMNDEVSFIGIYGMGGAGKTTLVKHIHNQLLDRQNAHHHVYWVTVSQDFSDYRLQSLIAKRIDLDLSNEVDVIHRAARLTKALVEKQKCVLILDDLWNIFDPEELGIPIKINGCKLIITSRSLDVCRQMGCERNVIKVEPLLEEEAWNLFSMELGNYDIELEPLAKSVASECDGLPLGLRTMARSMRGVYDVCQWRNALEELKESKVRLSDMEPKVFKILKFSYLHLKDSALQQCLLYCSLLPEDFQINREDLIEFLIAERIIEGRKSRRAEFDKGHEMINQLENACLLESVTACEDERLVKMHDLVRDMALQEMRKNYKVMVEAGMQLEELPDVEKWTLNLVRVSLMQNAIKEIPSGHSPRCQSLSTLLLCRNYELKFIGDSFFKQMQRIEVLDLSNTAIQKLPDSISDLVTLIALLLGDCRELNHAPSLGKLKALKTLDLHYTALGEVPPGLELLSSLKYLNLNGTQIQEFPEGILPKLCHLQVLRLCNHPYQRTPITVKVEELACLRKLEILECHFDNLLAFKKYLKEGYNVCSAMDRDKGVTQQTHTYKFLVGSTEVFGYDTKNWNRSIYLHGQEIKRCGDAWLLPKGFERLLLEGCSDVGSLCDLFASEHETDLKSLSIVGCHSMECLVSFSQRSLNLLGTIKFLMLHRLDNLSSICSKERVAPTPFLPGNGIFSHLKNLQITYCPTLKSLFHPGLLQNLLNLEEIVVRSCSNLERIISEEEEEESNISSSSSSSDLATEFSLPKLQDLELAELPALKSIGCGKLICMSLQKITINNCEELKRLPFSCSLLTLKVINIYPEIWWESVEWDLRNDCTVTGGYVNHCLGFI